MRKCVRDLALTHTAFFIVYIVCVNQYRCCVLVDSVRGLCREDKDLLRMLKVGFVLSLLWNLKAQQGGSRCMRKGATSLSHSTCNSFRMQP